MAPNRSQRIKVAKETLDILENGSYLSESYRHVTISSDIRASVEGAIVYSSTDLEALRKTSVPHNHETSIKVVDDFVVSCILKQREALGSSAKIACLNFASAKNVCGGMIRGSLAQEESLGLCSGLYPTLDKFQAEYYEVNRNDPREGLYHDTLIYSPGVPFFREDKNLTKLDDVVTCDIISCPAPNKGRAIKASKALPEPVDKVMERRIHNVLVAALEHKVDTLILGAWGCGVFQNQPEDVAMLFANALNGPFKNAISRVVFAIGDDQTKLRIFRTKLLQP